MASSIEAEMARFEEEISTANEDNCDDFKPPPLPPVMPPMFLPHALQANKGAATNAFDSDSVKDNERVAARPSLGPDFHPKNELNMQSVPSSDIRRPMGGAPPGPGAIGPNVGFGPGPGPRPMLNSLPPRLIGPPIPHSGPVLAGPMGPPVMMGPNPRLIGPPSAMGMNRPNMNILGPMPPPMPSFFPPPVLPDFGSVVKKQNQTTYSAAPVLRKKVEDSKESPDPKSTKSTEKAKEAGKVASEVLVCYLVML